MDKVSFVTFGGLCLLKVTQATEGGYGSVVERDLPKVETGVQFPLPAQIDKTMVL